MRLQLRAEHLTALFVLFLLSLCNGVFWQKFIEVQQPDSIRSWVFIGLGFVFLFTVFNAILTLLAWPYVLRTVLSLLLLITPFVVYFMAQYGVMINAEMIQNAIETNPAEVRDLFSFQLVLYVLSLGLLPIFVLWRTQIEFRPVRNELTIKGWILAGSILVLSLIAASYYKDFASLFRNHRELRYVLVPSNYIQASSKYLKRSSALKPVPVQVVGEDAHTGQRWEGVKRPSLTVLVVGETARASNFSLNGYERETNPELKKIPDLINFSDFRSCGTDTAVSVPCMFSMFNRDAYSDELGKSHQGLLDILQRAGLNVMWRDNQSGCKGACDRVAHESSSEDSDPSLCRDGECWDEILLKKIPAQLDALAQGQQSAVLVLHMMGSHGPAYYKRYPEQFGVFKPACTSNQLDKCTEQQIRNSYDNTLRYTDYVLAKLVGLLQKNQDRVDTAMVYVSDHGESLGEHGLYLHGSPYLLAPEDQTHIPAMMWFSPLYQRSRSVNTQCVRQKAAKSYSHDNLFHSVLGLLDVQTKTYQSKLDLFAGCRMDASQAADTTAAQTPHPQNGVF